MRGEIIKTRDDTAKVFSELGFDITDSYANFLFVRHEKSAPNLF